MNEYMQLNRALSAPDPSIAIINKATYKNKIGDRPRPCLKKRADPIFKFFY